MAKYSQTILGPVWFIIQPVLMTCVFTFVFRKVANLPTDNLPAPLFYMAGLLGWNYVNATFLAISNTFVGNSHVFSKVYFPRLIVPLSLAVSNLLMFLVQILIFAGLFIYYKNAAGGEMFSVSRYILISPFVVLQCVVLALGLGLCIASATAKYRDILQTLGVFSQVWFYGTPIIYSVSEVPPAYQWLLELNPMTGIVECIRGLLLGKCSVTVTMIATSWLITVSIVALGLRMFRKVERTVVDYV